MKHFSVLTLFPDLFNSFLKESIVSKGIENKLISVKCYNYRDQGLGKHQRVDDTPYGGGAGMLLRVEPIVETLKKVKEQSTVSHLKTILVTPQGTPFTQRTAESLSDFDGEVCFICGRYEGYDDRVRSYVDEEISLGDFICLGGETVTMVMLESIIRLIPGVIGNETSHKSDSFSESRLEYPQYTKPRVFEGLEVPEVLLSGNHKKIKDWRLEQSLERTKQRRPDLLNK